MFLKNKVYLSIFSIIAVALYPQVANAQETIPRESIWSSPGVLITLVLILIPIIFAIIMLALKSLAMVKKIKQKETIDQAKILAQEILENRDVLKADELQQKKDQLDYKLSNMELSGDLQPEDVKGLIQNETTVHISSFFTRKSRPIKRPKIDSKLTSLVIWFLGSAIFWLVAGTSVGEYLGIKFLAPDADTFSWLSFGRLRPVHTNLVFWGWASLGMLGLGYYVVPR